MSNVASGRLRHSVRLERQQHTQDANTGEVIVTWVLVKNIWIAIEPLSAREFIASQAMQGEVKGKIIMRSRQDIDETYRIVYRNKIYNLYPPLTDLNSGLEYITVLYSSGLNAGN